MGRSYKESLPRGNHASAPNTFDYHVYTWRMEPRDEEAGAEGTSGKVATAYLHLWVELRGPIDRTQCMCSSLHHSGTAVGTFVELEGPLAGCTA